MANVKSMSLSKSPWGKPPKRMAAGASAPPKRIRPAAVHPSYLRMDAIGKQFEDLFFEFDAMELAVELFLQGGPTELDFLSVRPGI